MVKHQLKWLDELEYILDGIDQDEVSSKNGWWETSTGADFGLRKKREIIQLFIKYINGNGI
jgi:hypothetical protein